jgi:hypothetical protein
MGSSFESWLDDTGIREEVTAAAIKAVIARQLASEMKKRKITKQRMAELMKTSRAQIDRLLDRENRGTGIAIAVGVSGQRPSRLGPLLLPKRMRSHGACCHPPLGSIIDRQAHREGRSTAGRPFRDKKNARNKQEQAKGQGTRLWKPR